LEVQNGEVETELLVPTHKLSLLQQLSTKGIKNLNHLQVGAATDHSLEALRADLIVDISHLFYLVLLGVLWAQVVCCPSAVDVLSLFKAINIHGFYEFLTLPL
jgi:hypothetical protein